MNLETFKELLLKQQSSGLTVKAFCEQEHLSMSNWCYWKRKCTTPMQDALVPMQLHHKVLGRDQESIPASSNGGLSIKELTAQIAWFQRQMFSRKSEKQLLPHLWKHQHQEAILPTVEN